MQDNDMPGVKVFKNNNEFSEDYEDNATDMMAEYLKRKQANGFYGQGTNFF